MLRKLEKMGGRRYTHSDSWNEVRTANGCLSSCFGVSQTGGSKDSPFESGALFDEVLVSLIFPFVVVGKVGLTPFRDLLILVVLDTITV